MANIQFQVRRGTAAEWIAANPVLASGELGFETDTLKLKCGDGLTSWSLLAYVNSSSVGGYPVALSSLMDGDVLVFHQASSSWVNRDDATITDGGNY